MDGDARLLEHLVGGDVPLVNHDLAGSERKSVVGVVPLLTLRLDTVERRLDRPDVVPPSCPGQPGDEIGQFDHLQMTVGSRGHLECPHLLSDLGIKHKGVDIDHGHHRVEMHRAACVRKLHRQDPIDHVLLEQTCGQRRGTGGSCSLGDTDRQAPLAHHQDVATSTDAG